MSCSTQKNAQDLNFTLLEYNEYGNQQFKEESILTSQISFAKKYAEVYQDHSPKPMVPTIDFKQKDVLFVHFGEFNYGGNQIDVKKIDWENENLVLTLHKSSPKAGEPVLTVMTYPFMFVEVDKLTKKPAEIQIVYD